MKTAVPATRGGGSWNIERMNTSSGIVSLRTRSLRMVRPRFQVVSTVKMAAPIISGNQPPARTLIRLAEKNATSTVTKMARNRIEGTAPHFHNPRTTTKASTVSIIIVSVTAMPYAEASALED